MSGRPAETALGPDPGWRQRARFAIRLRLALLLGFGVFAFAIDRAFSGVVAPADLYPLLAGWVAAWLLFRRFAWPLSDKALYRWYVAYTLVEIAAQGYLFHQLGGVSWIGFLPFVVFMVLAAFTLPRAALYGVAVVASAVIGGLTVAEANGWVAHNSPFMPTGGGLYRDPGYVAATVGVITAVSFLLLTLMVSLAGSELRWRQWRLETLSAGLHLARSEVRRSRQDLASRTAELEVLADIGKIVNSSLDLSQVHPAFAEALRRLIDFELLSIAIPGDDAGMLNCLLSVRKDGELGSRLRQTRREGSVMQWIIESERRIVVGEVETEFFFGERSALLGGGYRSVAAVPLFAKGQVIGSFAVASREPGAYDSSHLDAIERMVEPLGLAARNSALFDETGRRARRQAALSAIAAAVSSSGPLDRLYGDVIEQLAVIISFDEATLAVEHGSDRLECFVVPSDSVDESGHHDDEDLRAELTPRLVDDLELSRPMGLDRDGRRRGYLSSIRVPLLIKGHWAGLLLLNSRRRRAFRSDDIEFVEEVAHLLGIAIERAGLYEELRRSAETDPLTGLRNHRSMTVTLEREAARTRRTGRELSVLVLDIDSFKVFNDILGHEAGDRVLRNIARILSDIRQGIDVAARIGGDEFYVALAETDIDGAVAVAERIRTSVQDSGVRYPGQDAAISVSIGVAAFPTHGESIDEVVRAADAAMYEVKRAGGDGVRVGGGALPGEATRTVAFGLLQMLAHRAAQVMSIDSHVPPEAVAQAAVAIAQELGLAEEDRRALGIAAMSHRIGMFDEGADGAGRDRTPAGRRVSAQREAMGKLLIAASPVAQLVLDAAYYHHPPGAGGTGDGDGAEEIPLVARVLAVAEAFVELRANAGMPANEAASRLAAEPGGGLDPEVVGALVRWALGLTHLDGRAA